MVRKCPKCGKELNEESKNIFCSRSCANSRCHSLETKKKISEGVKKRIIDDPTIREKLIKNSTGKKRSLETRIKTSETIKNKIKFRLWSEISNKDKKKRVKEEALWKCERCGFDKKRDDGSSILEIDHVNGNTLDYSRQNLIALCPNCHALTETFLNRRGRGRSTKRYSEKWIEVSRKNRIFINLIKEAYETLQINFLSQSWPEDFVRFVRSKKIGGSFKSSLVVLKVRKLLPKFYVTRCFDVLEEKELFESKISVDEYAFF